jgi:hypothetical protein
MKFFYCENNGVTGVVTEETYSQIRGYRDRQVEAGRRGKHFDEEYPRPIFTFSDIPGLALVLTGSLDDMRYLLADHQLREGSFHVPFSHYSGHLSPLLHEVLENDATALRWKTSLQEVLNTFNLVPLPEGQPVRV